MPDQVRHAVLMIIFETILFQFAFKRHPRWLRRRLLDLHTVSLRHLLLAALMSS